MSGEKTMKFSDVFEILNLRYQWEELVKDFVLPVNSKDGTIENIEWFISTGAKGNRFRKGYDQALDIAKQIMSIYNEKTNLPGVHG